MDRKKLDRLLSAGGLVVAAVLLIAGGLLTWAHSFVKDEVHSQLSAQQIYFPEKGSDALKDPKIGPYLNKYAGQQLVNGEQARAYADHFIAVHVAAATGGKSYAEVSAASKAAPDDAKLKGQVETAFKGETLRGLLLNAYAFDTMGGVAFIASIAAYGGAVLMILLSGLGYVHSSRMAKGTPPAAPAREMIDA